MGRARLAIARARWLHVGGRGRSTWRQSRIGCAAGPLRGGGPCLVLIDEWVAYARQLYGKADLPGGSFDANLTFAQALTEAARAVPRTLVVASMPSSEIEIGGEGGKVALERLKNTFGRIESPWRPASAEEGFEIVRRRLFQPITDPQLFAARDAVVRAFADCIGTGPGVSVGLPGRGLRAPARGRLSDSSGTLRRLYDDWSSLDKFQRTRGVLRLMAAVIHALWERQDAGLLILPAMLPIDEPAVQFELTRYLDDPWVPVIEKDVDGAHSLPLSLDRDNPNLGRYSACRRVARTLFLGSAPTLHTANRGLKTGKSNSVAPSRVRRWRRSAMPYVASPTMRRICMSTVGAIGMRPNRASRAWPRIELRSRTQTSCARKSVGRSARPGGTGGTSIGCMSAPRRMPTCPTRARRGW